MPATRALLYALLLTPWLPAQDLKWNLPSRGAAIYLRDLKTETKVEPEKSPASPPWYGNPNAAVVLAGELDRKLQHSEEPLDDLRDLIAYVALDLSTAKAGKLSLDLDGGGRFLPVQIDVVLGDVAADGAQTFSATFAPAKAGKGAPPPSPSTPKLAGRMSGRRQLDRPAGRVAALQGELTLDAAYPSYQSGDTTQPPRTVHVTLRDAWTFDRLLAPADAEFHTMVAEGIRKAAEAVRRQLERRLLREPNKAQDPHHDAQPGELALDLLALVKAGEDVRDELLTDGYDKLRSYQIEGTYSLACAILAIEALYTPASEWQELRAGRLRAPMARVLTDADKANVADWLKTLMGNVDSTAKNYLRRWHYGPSTSFDNSNTQYALLGLFGAQLCGEAVSPQVWTEAGNHWLQVKIDVGADGAPQLVTHTDLERQKGGRGTRARGSKVPMLGWAYGAGGQPTGSMTCAGITGLTLCAAGLRSQKKGSAKALKELDDAARGGFLWLQQNLSVRRNPGPPGTWSSWYYYYLYGLERTCELNQIALLGDRDWYFEGAMQLLGQQRADGGWGIDYDTCFALLFLKKAALPAITPR